MVSKSQLYISPFLEGPKVKFLLVGKYVPQKGSLEALWMEAVLPKTFFLVKEKELE